MLDISKNSGIALAVVLLFMIVISIILVVTLTMVHSHYSLTKYNTISTQAFYAAEAGIHRALWRLKYTTVVLPPETFFFEGMGVTISYASIGQDSYEVRSSATVTAGTGIGQISATRQIRAQIDVQPFGPPPVFPNAGIELWNELRD